MQNYDMVYKSLNKEQRQAVDTIEGPVLVIAGPGTGKTQLLSARVANILSKTDTIPQSILCLTFTDSAAFNMRQRLVSMIGENAYDVHISTYHSFASDIIKSYPDFFETIDLETGKDSRMERPIDELRQLEIIKEIIEELPFTDALRSARYYLRSVVSTLSDFKQAGLSPAEILSIANDNKRVIEAVSPRIDTILHDVKRMPTKSAQAIDLYSQVLEILNANDHDLASTAAAELKEAIAASETENTTKPLTSWKNKWLTKDASDNWVFTNSVGAEKLISMSQIYEKYQSVLATSGQYDFNDMIMRTIEALQSTPELKYNLQEKYQYILLDEFQDTNAAQFKLVELLSDHPVHEGRPNVMAVGDDDQGIFAFQGANIGNMVSFIHAYRDVVIINLIKNYRSHHNILHVAHNIASQIESRLHHELEGVDKEIQAVSNDLPEKATVARHEFVSEANEYGWIAEMIQTKIESGTRPEEIAILAPKHSILENIVPFLNAKNIPVTYEKRENIFDTPIVQAIILICEFLAACEVNNVEKMDELLPRVLSLDFWEIPTQDIWELNWQYYKSKFSDYHPWAHFALQKNSTKNFTELLLHIGSNASLFALEYTLDFITGAQPVVIDRQNHLTSPFKEYYFSAERKNTEPLEFYEAISHLSVIRSHLRDIQTQKDTQLTIRDFIRLYETYVEAEQPLINTHPIVQNESSVQVMTVYKSKGLEYEYVFLPFMHDDVWGSRSLSNSSKIPIPENLKHIRHDGNTEDTKRRLLFVAVTRAKHGLIMTSHAKKENGKITMPVKYLRETSDANERISSVLPPDSEMVIVEESKNSNTWTDIQTLWYSRHTSLTPTLKSLLKERLQFYVMSPTHLNSFTNVEYAGPESFLMNTLLRFPEAPRPDSVYGDAIHRSLEWLQTTSNDSRTIDDVIDYFTKRISLSFLSSSDKDAYRQKGADALQRYLDLNFDRLRSSGLSEVDFRKEGATQGSAILTGKIDRIEIDTENKRLRITDFKTGAPSNKWLNKTKFINYKQQLYFYILLIKKSHSYKDFVIDDAVLEFIEPDEKGNIVPPLALQFDQDEFDQFQKLVELVWDMIQSLNLPDITIYDASVKGMKQFIDDLLKK